MFFMTGGVYLLGGLIFLLLGSGHVEEWARRPGAHGDPGRRVGPADGGEEDGKRPHGKPEVKPEVNQVLTLSDEDLRFFNNVDAQKIKL